MDPDPHYYNADLTGRGASASEAQRRRTNVRIGLLLAVTCVIAYGVYVADVPPATRHSKHALVRLALNQTVARQEAYRDEHGTYAADVDALPPLDGPAGRTVKVTVIRSDSRAFCLRADPVSTSRGGYTRYFDSMTGTVSSDPCG